MSVFQIAEATDQSPSIIDRTEVADKTIRVSKIAKDETPAIVGWTSHALELQTHIVLTTTPTKEELRKKLIRDSIRIKLARKVLKDLAPAEILLTRSAKKALRRKAIIDEFNTKLASELIWRTTVASNLLVTSKASDVWRKTIMRNTIWQTMISQHIGKMIFVGMLLLIGISDLSLYLVGLKPLLHWFNDGLLIFIGFVLMGTIVLMANEQ